MRNIETRLALVCIGLSAGIGIVTAACYKCPPDTCSWGGDSSCTAGSTAVRCQYPPENAGPGQAGRTELVGPPAPYGCTNYTGAPSGTFYSGPCDVEMGDDYIKLDGCAGSGTGNCCWFNTKVGDHPYYHEDGTRMGCGGGIARAAAACIDRAPRGGAADVGVMTRFGRNIQSEKLMFYSAGVVLAALLVQPGDPRADLAAFLQRVVPERGSIRLRYEARQPKSFSKSVFGFDAATGAYFRVGAGHLLGITTDGNGYSGAAIVGGTKRDIDSGSTTTSDHTADRVLSIARLIELKKHPERIESVQPREPARGGGFTVVLVCYAGLPGLAPGARLHKVMKSDNQRLRLEIDGKGRIVASEWLDRAWGGRYEPQWKENSPPGFWVVERFPWNFKPLTDANAIDLVALEFDPNGNPAWFDRQAVERMAEQAETKYEAKPIIAKHSDPEPTTGELLAMGMFKKGDALGGYRWPLVGAGATVTALAALACWRRRVSAP